MSYCKGQRTCSPAEAKGSEPQLSTCGCPVLGLPLSLFLAAERDSDMQHVTSGIRRVLLCDLKNGAQSGFTHSAVRPTWAPQLHRSPVC